MCRVVGGCCGIGGVGQLVGGGGLFGGRCGAVSGWWHKAVLRWFGHTVMVCVVWRSSLWC